MESRPRYKSLHIQAGFACQNNCIFCCDGGTAKSPRITSEDVRRTLEENAGIGVVQFTRHEPTLNPDLIEWVGWAKELGYHSICLITNGRKLGKGRLAERLMEAGINLFELSIHGHTPELHDRITRRKGSFVQVVEGIEAVSRLRREHGVGFKLHTTVFAMNVDYLPELADFCLAFEPYSYGLNAVFLTREAEKNADRVAIPYGRMIESFKRCLKPGVHRPITISEIPACLVIGRIPPNHVGWREDFHLVRVDEEGRAVGPRARSVSRGFIHREECERCACLSLCDGLPGAYIERFGWEGCEPVAGDDLRRVLARDPESPAFETEESIQSLVAAPGGEWRIDRLEVSPTDAHVHVVAPGEPERRLHLVLSPRDEATGAYRRTRRFNLALHGEGYSQQERDLAKAIVTLIESRE